MKAWSRLGLLAWVGVMLSSLCVIGCDGLGRSIVGDRPLAEGGLPVCEVGPSCESIRALPADHFRIPPDALEPPSLVDCDGDGFPDDVDVCPGVPSPTQNPNDCAVARRDCAHLLEGEAPRAGADLRGCRSDAELLLDERADLRGADLSCSSLRFRLGGSGQPTRLDLRDAGMVNAHLEVSASTAVVLDASGAGIDGSLVRVREQVRLFADGATINGSTLWLEPAGEGPAASDALLSLRGGTMNRSYVWEVPATWAGRVRVSGTTLLSVLLATPALELADVNGTDLDLDADTLSLLGGRFERLRLRAERAAFAGARVRDAIFARCAELVATSGALHDVDIPACPAGGLRIREVEVLSSRIGGGVELSSSEVAVTTFGAGPGSGLVSRDTTFDSVRFCDLEAAAFFGSELRCILCEAEDFDEGRSACLTNTEIYERGCPPLEFAPECL